jgi:hypothetical protein
MTGNLAVLGTGKQYIRLLMHVKSAGLTNIWPTCQHRNRCQAECEDHEHIYLEDSNW